MKTRMDELEAIVRNRICAICRDRTVEGACGMGERESCSLFNLFPLVAQAILATDSDKIEPYLQAIRENVCTVCIEQALDGNCRARNELRCALDAYIAPIVEAIEEASGRSLKRENLTKK